METRKEEIHANPIKQHHKKPKHAQHRRPPCLVFRRHPHMHDDQIHNPGNERKCFLRIPSPRPTPRLIRPDRTKNNPSPQHPKRQLQNHQIARVQSHQRRASPSHHPATIWRLIASSPLAPLISAQTTLEQSSNTNSSKPPPPAAEYAMSSPLASPANCPPATICETES